MHIFYIKVKKPLHLIIAVIIIFATSNRNISAQITNKPDTINNKRLNAVLITGGVLFAGSMFGLYNLWYKDYPQTHFHFIDDNNEWLQMDKIGHMVTSYYLTKIGYESFRWCGIDNNRSTLYGGIVGFTYMTIIEILDGFSAQWGASPGDLIANIAGPSIFIAQQITWKEQRFILKYSFHRTDFPQYRPDLLGKNLIQEMLKDYNGQTYWLSANIHSFLKKPGNFPRWLNIAFGYGATGMTGAESNATKYDGKTIPEFERYRQFYISLDADLTKINTRSDFLKILFNIIGFIKIPFPALEFNSKDGLKLHAFYF